MLKDNAKCTSLKVLAFGILGKNFLQKLICFLKVGEIFQAGVKHILYIRTVVSFCFLQHTVTFRQTFNPLRKSLT